MAPFQSCVHLAVSRSGRQAVRVELFSPNGDSVMSAGDAVSVGKNQKTFDTVRKVIGQAVVLRADPNVSTVMITHSTEAIVIGDGVEKE